MFKINYEVVEFKSKSSIDMSNSIGDEGAKHPNDVSVVESEDIDIETFDGLKIYVDSNLLSLRMGFAELREQLQKQSIYTHPHVVKQDDKIRFLRDELARRREGFQQREKSMQKVIEILGDENSRASHHHHISHAADRDTGGVAQTWEKPRRTVPVSTITQRESIESDNRFNVLQHLSDHSD